MKKIITYLMFAAAGVFSVSMASAKMIDYNVSVEKSESQIVKINFTNEENVQLSISDLSGNVLCNYPEVKKSRSFDFSNLPDGNYFIKVENSRYVETTMVSKSGTAVNVKKDYKLSFKPVFKKDSSDKMTIYVPNPTNSNVEIDVYDKDNYLVYSYTDNQTVVNKVFDFSKSAFGKYSINVSSSNDDANYSENFEHK